jgi:opacity protein-like surface antigen
MKYDKDHSREKAQIFLTLLSCSICAIPAYANSLTDWYAKKSWQPILTVGTGASIASNLGESVNIPIQNPLTDEFYNYSAEHSTQVASVSNVFIGAEWMLQSNWALQLGIDYSQSSSFLAKGAFLQGADIPSADLFAYNYNILTRQLLVEGKALYTYKKIFHPYLLAGIGASFNKAFNYSTNVPPTLTFTRMYADHSSSALSYAIGAGVDIDVTTHMRMGIGYRFADLGRVALGNAVIDTTSVSRTLSQSHLYANEVLAQLTWVLN